MRSIICFFLLLFALIAHAQIPEAHKDKISVSYIEFDKEIDDPAFRICSDTLIYPYYYLSTHYKGGRRAIRQYFATNYKDAEGNNASGYIAIRFVINCKGETGRFRMEQLDKNYLPYSFKMEIGSQLMQLVKGMKDWQPGRHKDNIFDTIYYLTFKIENGKLIDVLP